MIRVNLLGEEVRTDNSSRLIVAGYVASLVMCAATFFLINNSLGGTLETLTHDTEQLETRLNRLKETTKEVHDLEAKKEELNKKLVAIATLKKNKTGPVRVLDDLNTAVPERSWITELNEKAYLMHVIGYALDNQTIAAFMKDLEASDYFETVDLVETKQTEQSGVKMKVFTLQAKITYSGKIKAAKGADGNDKEKKDPAKTALDLNGIGTKLR